MTLLSIDGGAGGGYLACEGVSVQRFHVYAGENGSRWAAICILHVHAYGGCLCGNGGVHVEWRYVIMIYK